VWSSAFFAFLHFAAVFGIFCTVFYEWMAFSRAPTLEDARRIQQCDRWYGACAMALLAIGFLRVVYFEKGAGFYFANPFFHLKIGLFVLVGLLSIYPTLKFIGWGKATRQGQAPSVTEKEFTNIRRLLGLELLLLLAVALCASLMARGIAP
jgi:putative membrane protein